MGPPEWDPLEWDRGAPAPPGTRSAVPASATRWRCGGPWPWETTGPCGGLPVHQPGESPVLALRGHCPTGELVIWPLLGLRVFTCQATCGDHPGALRTHKKPAKQQVRWRVPKGVVTAVATRALWGAGDLRPEEPTSEVQVQDLAAQEPGGKPGWSRRPGPRAGRH